MEPNCKLLATTSSQAEGVCPENITDRFTNLPDEIAHQILSRVSFQDFTRVGAVSKRCNHFCHSAQSFQFSSLNDSIHHKANKMDCFDQLLRSRENKKMLHFGIDLSLPERLFCKVPQVMGWIDTAARCNVEVLELRLLMGSKGNMVEWPSSIFRCASLRFLSMHLKIFKVPSFPCPNNLQCLSLSYAKIDEGFSKWISTSCKCIKELKLYYVDMGNLTIESSSLKLLTFEAGLSVCCINISGDNLQHIDIKWQYNLPGDRLYIFAPNLKYFKWSGHMVSQATLGNLLYLEKAEIFVKAKSNCVCEFVSDIQNVFEVLCSISTAKDLILSSDTIKAWFENQPWAAPIFDTSYLRINIANLDNALVPAMVSLLKGMSNLNTLDILCDPSLMVLEPKACGYNGRYWKSQDLPFVNQLMEVTIELSKGTNGWQLARFILEHAQSLKKMTVFYPPKSGGLDKVINSKKISAATVMCHEKR